MLAGMLNFKSMDDFARALGPKWAYHIRPMIDGLMLSYYEDMKLARADGWDLVNTADGSPWPWPDLTLPKAEVQASRMQASGPQGRPMARMALCWTSRAGRALRL
jgi:hypothetical protein